MIIKSFFSCRKQGREYFTPLGWAIAHPLRCVLFKETKESQRQRNYSLAHPNIIGYYSLIETRQRSGGYV
nr:MAG TPA: hypothetical protein [Caudoviricetes sp.]